MLITIDTSSYNSRRYSKPWIARVTFEKVSSPDYQWGEWIGCSSSGSCGRLEIEAEPGDIIATGQKDLRKPRNSAPEFHVVNDDGTFSRVSKTEAVDLYREKKNGVKPIPEIPTMELVESYNPASEEISG